MSTLKVENIQHPSAASAALILDSSGNLALPAGSASTPALQGPSDTNTGLFFPTADTIAFAEGGTEALRIDSSGRVGIGTSSPVFNFVVAGSASDGAWFNSSGVVGRMGLGAIANSAGGAFQILYDRATGTTTFGAGTRDTPSTAFYIDSSNRLGIGTNSPGYALDVLAGTGSAIAARLRGNSTGNNNTQLRFYGNNAAADQWAIGGSIATNDTGRDFHIYDLIAGQNRFAINSSGFVGIGTTSPSQRFNLNIGGDQTWLQVDKSRASDEAMLQLVHTATNRGSRIRYANADSSWTVGIDGSESFVFTSGEDSVGAGGTERARIDSSGRLLVGTSSFSGNARAVFQGHSAGANQPGLIWIRRDEALSGSVSGADLGQISFGDNTGEYAQILAEADGSVSTNDYPGRLVFSVTNDGASSPTERVRINNYGYLKQSPTGAYLDSAGQYNEFNANNADSYVVITRCTNASPGAEYVQDFRFSAATPNNASARFWNCADASAVRAYMAANGGLYNYSGNNSNLSDRNAKKDITPAADTWDCIKEWEIVNYRYKDQPDDADLNLGVIAQQVAESCPEVITVFQEAKEATEDQPAQEERLGVKEQQMYWMAIKALQEAQVRIETLEAEVAALKAQ